MGNLNLQSPISNLLLPMSSINNPSTTVDYDLHGFVGIRLLNANPADVTMITRQLGPIQKPLQREPDITIRFVDKLHLSSPLRLLGVDEAAFTDDAFIVLRAKQKARAKVQIPFQDIGSEHCEIVVERKLPAVPLLIDIVNLTALSRGALPLHASAWNFQGHGMLATGWAKGGKTETLLAFMSNGGEYVGDEWVYLSADGERMYGIPEPIRIWEWHLQEMPEYWEIVKRSDRVKLRGLGMIARGMDRTVASGVGSGTPPIKMLQRVMPLLKKQMNVQLPPRQLFGQAGVGPMMSKPSKIFFVASHQSDEIVVEPMTTEEVARRMVHSLEFERLSFMEYYQTFRFAFPDKVNEFIENTEKIQRDILETVLAGKDAYSVYHPYPVAIPALYDAILPVL